MGFESITVRRELGRALRQARDAAGFSTRQAAEPLGMNQSSLVRIENAQMPVTPLQLTRLAYKYEVEDAEHLRWQSLLQEACSGDRWWDSYDRWLSPKYAELIETENEASSLITLAPNLVPGLLQTASYMQALFAIGGLETNSIEALIEVRRLRQRRLDDSAPLEVHALLSEAALRSQYGSWETQLEQLRFLRDKCDHPQVTVQVIEFARAIPMSVVDLYEFQGAGPPVVYSESVISKVPVEHIHALTVPSTRQYLDQVRSRALDPDDSAAFIEKLIAQNGSRT